VPRPRLLTVGLLIAVSLLTAAAITAASALAAPVLPGRAGQQDSARTGSFLRWRPAQRAAGFTLVRPTSTYGLGRSGPILVQRCAAAGEQRKPDVIASYGSYLHRLLGIQQNDSGGPCGNFGAARRLASYRVDHVTARLWGVCRMPHAPRCRARKIWLFLIWRKHGVRYQATSHNVWRAVIVGFARGLVAVGGRRG
jgi:hypothetical protein